MPMEGVGVRSQEAMRESAASGSPGRLGWATRAGLTRATAYPRTQAGARWAAALPESLPRSMEQMQDTRSSSLKKKLSWAASSAV